MTKQEQRELIARETARFLANGGKVTVIGRKPAKPAPAIDTRSQVDRAISTLSWVRSFVVANAPDMSELFSVLKACAEHSLYWANRRETQRQTDAALALAS